MRHSPSVAYNIAGNMVNRAYYHYTGFCYRDGVDRIMTADTATIFNMLPAGGKVPVVIQEGGFPFRHRGAF